MEIFVAKMGSQTDYPPQAGIIQGDSMRFFSILVAAFMLATPLFADQAPEEDVSKARLLLGPDRWLQFHYFLQTNINVSDVDGTWENDFQITRSRLILNGQVAPTVDFFMQTQDFRIGNSSADSKTDNTSTGESRMYASDAYVRFAPDRAFQVYAGLLAIPYLRMNIQSDATALCAIQDDLFSLMDNYSTDGRDAGVMLRGTIFSRPLEYRIGVFEGLSRDKASGRNPDDMPRFTGRLQWMVLPGDEEPGYFVSENYLGKRNIISIGVGADYQAKVCQKDDGSYKDYMGFAGDIAVDLGVTYGVAFALQGGFVMNIGNPGEGLNDAGTLDYDKLMLFYGQTGVLFFGKVQPVARFAYRKNTVDSGDSTFGNIAGGVNFFINGHHAAIKTLYTHPMFDSAGRDGEQRVDISTQIYF
jgi:hypothetical protein